MVDVVTGGFPCQDISCAGKGKGIEGKRSGLWSEMAEVVRQIRPKYVFVENSPALLLRGFGRVAGDMASIGYDCKWGIFSGKHVYAPIERKRIFIAFTDSKYGEARVGNLKNRATAVFKNITKERYGFWLQTPSRGLGMGNGVANYLGRVQAIGNGQIPQVVATAWEILKP